MHFAERLLLATNPMIKRFHFNFNTIPAGSTCRAAQKHSLLMRIANFRCPIVDLALKKNLKFILSNRKSKYYLLPYYNPKFTET